MESTFQEVAELWLGNIRCRDEELTTRLLSYLLTGSETCFMEPRNLQNHFRKYQEACRLRPVNFHALRHTFATRCIESGVDIKALSEILGHASVNITLNRYVHSSPEMKRRNMEKVRPLCRSDKVTEEVSPILAD